MDATTQASAEETKELHSKQSRSIYHKRWLNELMSLITQGRLVALKKWLENRRDNRTNRDTNTRLIDLMDQAVRQLKVVSLASLSIASNHLQVNAALYNDDKRTFLAEQVKCAIMETCRQIWDDASDADKLASFGSDTAHRRELETWIMEEKRTEGAQPSMVGTSILSVPEVNQLLDDCTCLGYPGIASWTEGPTAVAPDDIDTTRSIEDDIISMMNRTLRKECPRPGLGCLSGDIFVFREENFFKLERPEGSETPFSISDTAWSDSSVGTAQESSQ
jgi:hypothetical protein